MSETESGERLSGNSHGLRGCYLIRCDGFIGQGDCLRGLDEYVLDDSFDRGVEVLTAIGRCFGQPSGRRGCLNRVETIIGITDGGFRAVRVRQH